uniref:uncharacterized protein LOC118142997 isoform X1 n=1 Tax=Callithrix jacchus TaxID=9483 RepID=UPI00159DBD77|nr:uncharacterized protein LOC118142997 isoform X1 [Callithrix jacchus]XP_035107859.1 uncharacterized protein LOC118142997 isoform X1 [Callithrix jacchus]
MPSDMDIGTATNDLSPSEDCRSITSEDDGESSSLAVYDQQGYPAACPHMKSFPESLSVTTEESSSLTQWMKFVSSLTLPGINSSEEVIAIHKGHSTLLNDELEDSIAGSHQQVQGGSQAENQKTWTPPCWRTPPVTSGSLLNTPFTVSCTGISGHAQLFSFSQVEESSKPAEKATKKLKVKKERKTSKPRKNTRRHAQNILDICKIC